jgi:hypothetical protein
MKVGFFAIFLGCASFLPLLGGVPAFAQDDASTQALQQVQQAVDQQQQMWAQQEEDRKDREYQEKLYQDAQPTNSNQSNDQDPVPTIAITR